MCVNIDRWVVSERWNVVVAASGRTIKDGNIVQENGFEEDT